MPGSAVNLPTVNTDVSHIPQFHTSLFNQSVRNLAPMPMV